MRHTFCFSLLLGSLLTLGLGARPAAAQTGEAVNATANGTLLGMSKLSTEHTTLMKAVKAAGLEEAARGTTKYTVFAPTNAAFDKLPAGKLNELLRPANKGRLAQLIGAHVVPGSYLAANLTDGLQLQTVQGETLTVVRQAGGIALRNSQGTVATITNDDIVAENGIIHSIDAVLTPAAAPAQK